MASNVRKIHAILTPGERKNALSLLGLMAVGMVLETLGIGLVIPTIALLTQGNLASSSPALQTLVTVLGNPTEVQLVAGGMLSLVAVYLVKALLLAFLAWRQKRFAFGVQAELSQRLFTAYLHQPYTFHLRRNSAHLIRNITTEIGMFGTAIGAVMTLLTEGLVMLGIAVLLLLVEPVGALVVVVVLSSAGWGFHQATRTSIGRWGEARQFHEGMRIQHLQQGLGGAKDVKLLGRESDFLAQYGVHNTESARVGQFQATLQQLPRLWLELLAVVGLAILVLSMLAQERELTSILPTLGLFAAAAFRLMPSVNRVLNAVQSLRYNLPVIDTLHEELKLVGPASSAEKDVSVAVTFQSDIRLEEIIYSYPGAAAPALNGLTITVRKGESVGFVGSSGAGKTTLVDVILGLLTPDGGHVWVDGRDIQENLRTWQDQIGYVPQSIFLTDDTLRRNVAFGLPEEQIDDSAVERAIRAAQLDELVTSLHMGLDTIVGERGVRLSGGQCQRVGIARALYHDPAVLVLDEATSSLDTATELGVMEAVTALQGSKTVLIVAHRLSTVEQCDRLYRVEHGKVVDEGAPHRQHA